MYKCCIKIWIQCAVDSMVQQSVAHACLVYVARLRVGYLKRVVTCMLIYFFAQLSVQCSDLIYQISLELQHIKLAPLASAKLLPRFEQIFYRDDIFIYMSEDSLRATPPPTAFARFGANQTSLLALA